MNSAFPSRLLAPIALGTIALLFGAACDEAGQASPPDTSFGMLSGTWHLQGSLTIPCDSEMASMFDHVVLELPLLPDDCPHQSVGRPDIELCLDVGGGGAQSLSNASWWANSDGGRRRLRGTVQVVHGKWMIFQAESAARWFRVGRDYVYFGGCDVQGSLTGARH